MNTKSSKNELLKKVHPEIIEDEARAAGFSRSLDDLAQLPWTCSGELREAMSELEGKHRPVDLEVSCRVTWAGIQWARNGRPILKINEELRNILLMTEPPEEALDVLPNLPFEGFYIVVDGFDLLNHETGNHQIEGIYVCRDKMRRSAASTEAVDALLLCAIGEDKGGKSEDLLRNDTINYCGIVAGEKLHFLQDLVGGKETIQVVLNLLFLWNSEGSPITTKTVIPAREKKSPKKLKKLARKHSLSKYITLGLREGFITRNEVRADSVQGWSGPTHITMVRGFFRRYWVNDPKGAQVLQRKAAGEREQYLIRKFVAPHPALRRGEAPQPNVFEVTNRGRKK